MTSARRAVGVLGYCCLLILGALPLDASPRQGRVAAIDTSFEEFTAGPLLEATHAGLTLEADAGHAQIDPQHRRTGKLCLRVLGGTDRTVELTAHLERDASRIAFWAERWTSRAPFSFVIEARRGGRWVQVHDASQEVRVGSFGAHVQVSVQNASRFRLRCSSPENTGVLIDDLRIDREAIEVPAPPKIDMARLQPGIDAAIDRGIAYLIATQGRDGAWGYDAHRFRTGQTALCAYTLLESGLSAAHPAVRRALAHMRHAPPHEVYSVSCHLLALAATNDPRHHPRMQELLDALLSWQADGHWGYPFEQDGGGWGEGIGRTDLSNTQYAALGMRAAQRAGLEVPARAWESMLERALEHQTKPVRVDAPRDHRSSAGIEMAGFFYGANGNRTPTGSMTTAGTSIVRICVEGLGKRLGRRPTAEAERAIELGIAWLAHHFAVDRNPGRKGWIYYYLYGLERVGALLEVEEIGGHAWYPEGAKHLVARQAPGGHWADRSALPDTCFALLFLQRATRPTTGSKTERRTGYECDGRSEVYLQAHGNGTLTVWLRGFSDAARTAHGDLWVVRVEYLIDGLVVATVTPKDEPRAWTGADRFAVQHEFELNGRYEVSARVFLEGEPDPLTGAGFEVVVSEAFEPWMDGAANRVATNLLGGREVTATASSSGKGGEATAAVDGLESTGWICAAHDAAPTLELAWRGSVGADRIVIGPLPSSPHLAASFDRVRALEVVVNGDDPMRVELAETGQAPAVVTFDRTKPIRSLRIRLVERVACNSRPGRAGIAEVALERR